MVSFVIDGREKEAPKGQYILQAAQGMGITIPTLCHHPDLEPAGACRLCMVEVTHPDWGGWSGLMTACLYPVAAGIQVSTSSPRVLRARRRLLSLLAARCPGSALIQGLAQKYGAGVERLSQDPDADNCILCGLCTRVCEAFATSAIITYNRGASKSVGSFFEVPPVDCVGCGACELVCPTGHIESARTAEGYHIWGRSFPTAHCTVWPKRCVGCGACEDACPFDVARVSIFAGGARVARIPAEHCRGCGACVGACPTGAILQPQLSIDEPGTGPDQEADHRTLVIACSRANLSSCQDLQEKVRLMELPCIGRVTVPLLLRALASGARGVLVLGRHQQTCRMNGAEDPARECCRRAAALARMIGLGPQSVRFVEADPGPRGGLDTVARTLESMGDAVVPALSLTDRGEGLDSGLALLEQLSSSGELHPDATTWQDLHGLPTPPDGGVALCVDPLPQIQLLASDILRPLDPARVATAGLDLLAALDQGPGGVHVGHGADLDQAGVLARASRIYHLDPAMAEALAGEGLEAASVDDLLRSEGGRLPRPGTPLVVACHGEDQLSLVQALGHRPMDVGPDPLAGVVGIACSPGYRTQAEQHLARAEDQGAQALLVSSPQALARWALMTRQGTWRSSRILPKMGIQLTLKSAAP